MRYYLIGLVILISVSADIALADDKVVVIPLGSGADVQVVRVSQPNYYACLTLNLEASCPAGYKVVGGSVACGSDTNLFGSDFRAINSSGKTWNQENWYGTCIDLSNPTTTCAPKLVEAICVK